MKPHLLLILSLGFNSVYSQNVKPGNNDKFVYGNNAKEKWTAYKKVQDSTYYILDENKKMVYSDLKYFSFANVEVMHDNNRIEYIEALQVLNKNNKIQYIDRKNLQLIYPDITLSRNHFLRCGNEPHFSNTIVKNDTAFQAYQIEDDTYANGDTVKKKKLLTTIPFAEADTIMFLNKESEGDRSSSVLIYKKDGKYGLWGKTEAIYDQITTKYYFTEIKKNNLFSYLEISKEPKYIALDDFEFGLAKMKLPNGKTGYIDNKGNEFLNN